MKSHNPMEWEKRLRKRMGCPALGTRRYDDVRDMIDIMSQELQAHTDARLREFAEEVKHKFYRKGELEDLTLDKSDFIALLAKHLGEK